MTPTQGPILEMLSHLKSRRLSELPLSETSSCTHCSFFWNAFSHYKYVKIINIWCENFILYITTPIHCLCSHIVEPSSNELWLHPLTFEVNDEVNHQILWLLIWIVKLLSPFSLSKWLKDKERFLIEFLKYLWQTTIWKGKSFLFALFGRILNWHQLISF